MSEGPTDSVDAVPCARNVYPATFQGPNSQYKHVHARIDVPSTLVYSVSGSLLCDLAGKLAFHAKQRPLALLPNSKNAPKPINQ